jgi:hypothetical protein
MIVGQMKGFLFSDKFIWIQVFKNLNSMILPFITLAVAFKGQKKEKILKVALFINISSPIKF